MSDNSPSEKTQTNRSFHKNPSDSQAYKHAYAEIKEVLARSFKALAIYEHCPGCYAIPNACGTPHLILWVRFDGTYWPAKLLGATGASVHVITFGDHKPSTCSAKGIFLFSLTAPGDVPPEGSANYALHTKAIKVIEPLCPRLAAQ